MVTEKLWNANIHYHPLLLEAIPKKTTRVLDIGCGEGVLCAQLVQAGVRHVVGIDADAGVLERARSRHSGLPIEWVHGDIFDVSLLEPARLMRCCRSPPCTILTPRRDLGGSLNWFGPVVY